VLHSTVTHSFLTVHYDSNNNNNNNNNTSLLLLLLENFNAPTTQTGGRPGVPQMSQVLLV
jgi:hypothetical protein